jgi:tetratricopeptide (TPR) repeat protein
MQSRMALRACRNRGQSVSTGVFMGVYSSLTTGAHTGHGPGRRKQYWFVWDSGDAGYGVQALDGAFHPQGEALVVEPSIFRASFTPEPSILAAPMRRSPFPVPPSRPQDDALSAKTHEQHAAERAEVENHMRAHFGALLLKIRRGDDVQAALKGLQDIAEVEEGIVPEHKYMFAEFGVNLRKGQLPEIALVHAKRVLSLAPGDSHAHFNVARIYHMLGKLGEAEQHLLAALEFSPDLECARDMLAYIGKERHQKQLTARRARFR